MGKAFESPSTSLDDGVADQPVDEQRQRAHRHTPAAADVDRLELTTGHQLVLLTAHSQTLVTAL